MTRGSRSDRQRIRAAVARVAWAACPAILSLAWPIQAQPGTSPTEPPPIATPTSETTTTAPASAPTPPSPPPEAAPAPATSFAPTGAVTATLPSPAALSPTAPSEAAIRRADAHADRVILIPTAYTHPAGTAYVSSYDIVVLQAGYAITDRVQVSLLTTPPIEGALVPIDLSVKTVLLRDPRVRVAALASASGIGGLEDFGFLFIGRAGGIVQFCLDTGPCRRSVTVTSNVGLLGPVLMLWNGAGLIWPLGAWVSLLVEVDTVIPVGVEGGPWNGMLLSAGLRFPGKRWGVDLALGGAPRKTRPRQEPPATPGEAEQRRRPTVLPLLAVTYRF